MSGTKIFVLQLKDLIKSAVFAAIGLLLIILLIYLFVPRSKAQTDPETASGYIPGTYTSEIVLHNNPVSVEVTVTESEIVSVDLKNMAETQEVFYPLFSPTMENLSKEIVRYQSIDITPSAEYPVTEQILLNAVNVALDKAKAAE